MKLIIDNVEKSFSDKKVLKGASFEFESNKIYGLLGRNGSGKTTLFNCISGELGTEKGKVFIEKNGVKQQIDSDDIGYVYTTPILPEFLTGYEFIKFYIDINKNSIEDNFNANYYFDIFQIEEEDRHKLIKNYSHGMKNKIQMMLFIISKPPVILLDEPLTSFDIIVALEMKKILRDMKKDRILIFSTHVLQLAVDLCDEIVVLNNGVLEAVDNKIIKTPEFESEIIKILGKEE